MRFCSFLSLVKLTAGPCRLDSSYSHLSGKEPHNECLQHTGKGANIGLINYGRGGNWQSDGVITVTVGDNMSPDSGWLVTRAAQRQNGHKRRYNGTHAPRQIVRHASAHTALSPCHFVALSHPHQIGQKRSLLTFCSGEGEQTGKKNKETEEERHLNDSVIIKGSCSGLHFENRHINIFHLKRF